MNIGPIDLTLLAVYLLGMVGFGLWMGRGSKNSADYMVGGRDLPWYAVLFSIVATETSTITFLSVPGMAWKSDLTFLQLPLGYIVGRLIVCVILLPGYFAGNMFTAYEVLDKRFGGAVKRAASVLFIVTRTLGDGFRLYLGAIVLEQVANIPLEQAVIILGVATIIYTFVGGIRAVVWTDFVQFVVYMLGAFVAFYVLVGSVDGGMAGVLELASDDKLRTFDFGFDLTVAHQFWAGLIGGGVFAIGTHGVDQLMVQRYLCARNLRQARLALGWSGPLVLLQFAFFMLIGIALYAYYLQHPPAVAFEKPDRVFASFIVDHMPVGVLGIVLGALFSAAMSTLSSSLNSSATVLVNDILPVRTDAARLRLVKLLTIVFGVAQITVGIAGKYLVDQSVINKVLTVQGFTTGVILGVFLLGIATRSVTGRAAMWGLLGGIAVMSYVAFGTALAWPWYVLVGSTATFGIGMLAQTTIQGRQP